MNVSGTWTVGIRNILPENDGTAVLVLEQTNETLTGSYAAGFGVISVSGSIRNNKLSLHGELNGQTLRLSGVVEGQITGSVELSGAEDSLDNDTARTLMVAPEREDGRAMRGGMELGGRLGPGVRGPMRSGGMLGTGIRGGMGMAGAGGPRAHGGVGPGGRRRLGIRRGMGPGVRRASGMRGGFRQGGIRGPRGGLGPWTALGAELAGDRGTGTFVAIKQH